MDNSIIEALFSSLVRVSGQAAVLVVLVLGVQAACGRWLGPQWRHALWLLVFVRLTIPSLPESRVSVFSWAPEILSRGESRLGSGQPAERAKMVPLITPQASGLPPAVVEPRALYLTKTPVRESGWSGGLDPGAEGGISQARMQGSTERLKRMRTATAVETSSRLDRALRWLPWGWLLGAGALGLRLLLQDLGFRARLQVSSPVRDAVVLHTLAICGRLMRVPRLPPLLETDLVKSPALYGVVRPRLLLPKGFAGQFTLAELRFIFMHELGHLKRLDMLQNLGLTLLQGLHWFNPVLWFAFHRMRVDRELACDALVLSRADDGESRGYGETIIKIVSGLNRPTAVPGLVGILEDKTQMRRRIRAIARFRKSAAWSPLAVGLVTVLALVALTEARSQQEAAPPAAPTEAPVDRVERAPAQPEKPAATAPGESPASTWKDATLVEDARLLIEMGKLDEAEAKLKQAMRGNPEDRNAFYLASLIKEKRYAQRAKQPERPEKPPAELGDASKEIADGRMLLEMGKLDEAEAKLTQALQKNPDDLKTRFARYYLSLVQEARTHHQFGKREMPDADALTEVERAWNAPVIREGASPGTSGTLTNRLSAGRARIYEKLQKIVVDEVLYDGLPLSEVVRDLNEQARLRDPDKVGINIILDPTGAHEPGQSIGQEEPTAGRSLNDVIIRLRLNHVRLIDVIDVVSKVAEAPIRWTVLEYGVVFAWRGGEPEPLFTRTYRIDPNTLLGGLDNLLTSHGLETRTNLSPVAKLKRLFEAAGVNLGGATADALKSPPSGLGPQKTPALFFSDKTGLLLARATMQDLDTIEKVVQMLNVSPPQLVIETRLVETPAGNAPGLGLDRFSAQTPTNKLATVTGVMTDPQFRAVIEALEQGNKARSRSGPKLATLSGRQARVEVPALGFALEVLPTVQGDGISVNMEVDLTLSTQGQGSESGAGDDRGRAQAETKPVRVKTSAMVWDGQTLVLGPFPGGIGAPTGPSAVEPASDSSAGKSVLVFVTPTLVDPAGDRVHP